MHTSEPAPAAPQPGPPDKGHATDVGPAMRAVYDRLASAFAVRNAALPAIIRAAGSDFLALAWAVAGEAPPSVVDLGCGPGRDMTWLEATGARMVGLDLAAGMLAQARARTVGPLLQADLRHIPLVGGRFHGVWCNAALLHLPRAEVPAALAGIRHLLVPGGALFLSLQEGEGEGWVRGAYGDPNAARFFARYAPDEVVALLERLDFDVRDLSSDSSAASGSRGWLRLLATAAPAVDHTA